jgi:hypothetical protein
MSTESTNHIRTAAFAAETRAFYLRNGGDKNDPALSGTLARRVRNLFESAALPSVRVRNQYTADRRYVPLAAKLLGLRSSAR